jgi:hypothetical protein
MRRPSAQPSGPPGCCKGSVNLTIVRSGCRSPRLRRLPVGRPAVVTDSQERDLADPSPGSSGLRGVAGTDRGTRPGEHDCPTGSLAAAPGLALVPSRLRCRPLCWRGASSDSGAGTAETVLAVPFLMLLILMIVQFAVWEHASAIAQDAATEALAVARVQGGTAAAGQQRAAQVLTQVGGGTLTGVKVTITRTAATVTVQISAAAEEVLPLPGLSFTVAATAAGPVERFVPEG